MKRVTLEVVMPPNMKARDVDEKYLKNTTRPLGAFLNEGGKTARPLDDETEKQVLAKHLGIGSADPEFETKLKNFWSDLREVPQQGKCVWDVPESAKEALDNPGKIRNFCLYHLALRHPNVANSPEVLNQGDNPRIGFVLKDMDEERKKQVESYKAVDKAHEEKLKYASKPEVTNQVLRIISKRNISELSQDEKDMELSEVVNNQPENFVAAIQDKKLQNKAFGKELVDLGIVEENRLADGTVNYTFLDNSLGNSLEKLASFLGQTNKNSEIINKIKSQYDSIKSA
jgi:hypothetical protein